MKSPILKIITTLAVIIIAVFGITYFKTHQKTNTKTLSQEQEQKTPDDTPKRYNLTGTYMCLPEKEATKPCKPGIETEDNVYALDFGLMSQTAPHLTIGDKFSANGTIFPKEKLNSYEWQEYPIAGIFSVTDSVILDKTAWNIENTAAGKLYTNNTAGFNITIPTNTSLDFREYDAKEDGMIPRIPADENLSNPAVSISIIRLDPKYNFPGFNGAEAQKEADALAEGKLIADKIPSRAPKTPEIISIQGTNIKTGLYLNQALDVCDVEQDLGKTATLYHNGYQINITVHGPSKDTTQKYPQYFTTNKTNCGQNPVWKPDGRDNFASDLKSGKITTTWYTAFDKIIQSIKFN